MTGRVLSEEELNEIEQLLHETLDIRIEGRLITTIRDRDKTIAELKGELTYLNELAKQARPVWDSVKQQNTIMLSAFERMYPLGHNNDCMFCGFKDKLVEDTIAQVKALNAK